MRVTITNPLPVALAHYEVELLDCLGGVATVLGDPSSEGVEGLAGLRRVGRGLRLMTSRCARLPRSDLHLVLWPAFGYLDPLTWLATARRQRVVLILHDIDPLRRQFGHSRAAHRAFRAAVGAGGIEVVCHTDAAAHRMADLTSVRAQVVPHPMLTPKRRTSAEPGHDPGPDVASAQGDLPRRRPHRPVVRVLGQYKSARDLQILGSLATQGAAQDWSLEVWGRGWPAVPGWLVQSEFVDEAQFARLVATSSAVVIPYGTYSQSGVMVRAAESCVPVVGVEHPQLSLLYGARWPGAVMPGGTWADATRRAIAAAGDVPDQVGRAHATTRAQWAKFLEGMLAP